MKSNSKFKIYSLVILINCLTLIPLNCLGLSKKAELGNTKSNDKSNSNNNSTETKIVEYESPEIRKDSVEVLQTPLKDSTSFILPLQENRRLINAAATSAVNDFYMSNNNYNSQLKTTIINPQIIAPVSSNSLYQPNFLTQPSIQQNNQGLMFPPNQNNRAQQHIEVVQSRPQVTLNQACPCAAYYRCPPCGIINLNANYPPPCSCAPKLNCQKCPPLSVIHEIASRKAIQDQKLATELKNLSTSMTQIIKNISKFAGDVLKFETEAREASIKMEEASIKAQLARQQMERTSEQARMIAQKSLVRCDDCLPSNLGSFDIYTNDKVFPEEVDSIGEFMKDTYSTNMNSYNMKKNDYTSNIPKVENEAEGNIEVESLSNKQKSNTGTSDQEQQNNIGTDNSNNKQ